MVLPKVAIKEVRKELMHEVLDNVGAIVVFKEVGLDLFVTVAVTFPFFFSTRVWHRKLKSSKRWSGNLNEGSIWRWGWERPLAYAIANTVRMGWSHQLLHLWSKYDVHNTVPLE
ncbi:hypothetical protein DFP72DRAFT_846033 [Ephemerocybe angulata]|uniref:Uncharacterized protein n=1 Tax=Ephemerocybe angulata TaxID=980116 RepID=A0A8H6I451_9AGAR|nr:hypothetical protein DFP72DRAFT_846033 [Tulosesus angulatus]